MAKEHEEFLKSIDSIKLVEKINKFRGLNIKNMKLQDIEKAISEVLTWNGDFSYLTNIGTYPIGTHLTNIGTYPIGTQFYRIRKLKGSLIPNESLSTYADFWEPPKSCVKSEGRLNKKGESLLYVTPEDPKFH